MTSATWFVALKIYHLFGIGKCDRKPATKWYVFSTKFLTLSKNLSNVLVINRA